ncbi:MAG: hypothetical protein ACYSTX_03265 [Planctomycetota bacterium]|jgi:hypothetical protein
MKTKTKYLIAAGVVAAVAGYFIWKSRQKEAVVATVPEGSRVKGGGVVIEDEPTEIVLPTETKPRALAKPASKPLTKPLRKVVSAISAVDRSIGSAPTPPPIVTNPYVAPEAVSGGYTHSYT